MEPIIKGIGFRLTGFRFPELRFRVKSFLFVGVYASQRLCRVQLLTAYVELT